MALSVAVGLYAYLSDDDERDVAASEGATMSAWECPRCGRMNAIWVERCICPPRTEYTNTTTNTGATPASSDTPKLCERCGGSGYVSNFTEQSGNISTCLSCRGKATTEGRVGA